MAMPRTVEKIARTTWASIHDFFFTGGQYTTNAPPENSIGTQPSRYSWMSGFQGFVPGIPAMCHHAERRRHDHGRTYQRSR